MKASHSVAALILLTSPIQPICAGAESPLSESAPKINLTARVLSQKYCYADAEVFTVWLEMKLHIVNLSKQNLILARKMQVAGGSVASTLESAQQGKFEEDLHFHMVYPGTTPPPTFGPRPDSRFVVLTPGNSYETKTTYGVPVRYKASKTVPGTIPPGSHVLRVDIGTWPYPTMGKEAIEAVKELWSPYGNLLTSDAQSDFVPFSVPERVRTEDCSKHSRKNRRASSSPGA